MHASASNISPALLNNEVARFAIDSREVKAGAVFFGLSQPDYANNGFNGDFEDSTRYVPSAFAAGAAACVIRHNRMEEHYEMLEPFHNRLIVVDDTIVALQNLAHGVYADWGKKVVAITGSAGKTTAKELTAHVLSAGGVKVLRNIKNYNNGLGHPLTVLNLAADPGYDIAVLEMGMSTPMNEIARLCRITPPDVSVVLNVLPVHLEHLGSIENIASAKAEIIEGMKEGGAAVLNADDELVAAMAVKSKGPVVTYGFSEGADVRAANIEVSGFGDVAFELIAGGQSHSVKFPLNGRHNISNALAAAAVGVAVGMSVADIALRLETVAAPPQRGEVLRFTDGFTVINDSYNSNPTALLSMTRTMVEGAGGAARKIVVAGEMLELGPAEVEIHAATGADLAQAGVDMLIGVRGAAKVMVEAARAAGLNAVFAEDSADAADKLSVLIRPGDVVLIKGSRGVRTEVVVENLLEKFTLENNEDTPAAA